MTARDKALEVRRKLNAAGIWHQSAAARTYDTHASIDAVVPGERWEIDVHHDGTVEVEVFRSQGIKAGDAAIDGMIAAQVEADRAGEVAVVVNPEVAS